MRFSLGDDLRRIALVNPLDTTFKKQKCPLRSTQTICMLCNRRNKGPHEIVSETQLYDGSKSMIMGAALGFAA